MVQRHVGMWVVGEPTFSGISSLFPLNLQHRHFSFSLPLCVASSLSGDLPPPLPYCSFLHFNFCLGFLSRAKKEGGVEREEKWCHTAVMPEHWMNKRWKESGCREENARGEEAASPWEFSHCG